LLLVFSIETVNTKWRSAYPLHVLVRPFSSTHNYDPWLHHHTSCSFAVCLQSNICIHPISRVLPNGIQWNLNINRRCAYLWNVSLSNFQQFNSYDPWIGQIVVINLSSYLNITTLVRTDSYKKYWILLDHKMTLTFQVKLLRLTL
jgi:hypothetical protein